MTRRRYSFFIDRELFEGLKALKERDGMPEAEAIRRALGAFLERKGVLARSTLPSARRRPRG